MGGGTVIASRARRDPRGRLCADFRHRYPPRRQPYTTWGRRATLLFGARPTALPAPGTRTADPGDGGLRDSDPTDGTLRPQTPREDPEASDPHRLTPRSQTPAGGSRELRSPVGE
ncbi:uncharacterized protein LOC117063731 [Trachypithecus francoisi]|uniref:uncharacterized protein LOC117063731 n=1 Tax=Trachypithecus francoisi TaxID=54180 RepID=UPI00141BE5BD|nr:uncharacterized protein LOC117063731 [Trachypithecus francoisi]